MTKVVLGLDGGGTKTVAVAVDIKTKEALGYGRSGCSNKNSAGNEKAKQAIFEALNGALKEANLTLENVVGISLGMSGVDRPEDKTIVMEWLDEFCGNRKKDIEFRVSNDAFTAISSGTLGILHGMVIIAGTGSICIGTDGTNSVRVGGWGPLLGDEGSGWAIGHEVCVSVARAVDGLGPQTILVDMIQEFLNLENPQQLIPWTYKDLEWSRMANIATLALRAYEKGDEVATGILERASTRLVEYAECVAKKMKWEDEFTLVLNGSLVTSEDSPLRKMVMDKISKKLPKAKITFPSVPPEMGAALLLIK